MNEIAQTLTTMRMRLSDERYWMKSEMFEPVDFDEEVAATQPFAHACLLGAHLDTLTDRAAWVEGDHFTTDPEYVASVINSDPLNIIVVDAIRELFPERIYDYHTAWEAIPSFNDHSATVHADVMAVMDMAIAMANETDLAELASV